MPKLFFALLNLSIYRDKNLFKAGTHYYSVGEGKQRGKHIYNLELCRKALLERTAKNTRLNETYDEREIRKIIDRKAGKKELSFRKLNSKRQ